MYFPAPNRCTMHIYTHPAHPEWVCAANETPPVSPGLLKNYTIRFFNWNPPGVWYGVVVFILQRSPASPAISHVVVGAAHRRRIHKQALPLKQTNIVIVPSSMCVFWYSNSVALLYIMCMYVQCNRSKGSAYYSNIATSSSHQKNPLRLFFDIVVVVWMKIKRGGKLFFPQFYVVSKSEYFSSSFRSSNFSARLV